MTRYACVTSFTLFFISLTVPVLAQNYFLYTPTPVSAEEKSPAKAGVLVREITVQKGDTLSGLSRKFSGRGSYYPQILLFNDIKNPHLIHIGDSVKVPVTRSESTEPRKPSASKAQKKVSVAKPASEPVGEISLKDLKQADTGRNKKQAQRNRKQAQRAEAKKQHKSAAAKALNSTSPGVATESASGTALFQRAHEAYRQGDCTTALELFDRYLAEHASSSQAADASLYKADCYMKLSGQ